MRTLAIGLVVAFCVGGCDNKPGAAPTAAASASASVETWGVPIGIPGDEPRAKVIEALNPKHVKPYAGPVGTLKGRVRMEGEPPPDTKLTFQARCKESAATYGKLFRVGLDGGLADAMVAVTRYEGFVPAPGPAMVIPVRGCAPKKRTVVMTFGQRLEVANIDKTEPHIPFLDGAPARAGMVAVPGGEPVKLYPLEPGHYMLRDQMETGLVADVFVLKFPTHDVTDLDGMYEVKGIPVGKVRVDVFLPVIGKTVGQDFEIKAGENKLDLTMKFDASKDLPGAAGSARPAASGAPPQPKVPH